MWGEAMGECPAYRKGDYPSQEERTAARILAYVRDGKTQAFELIEAFPAGRGTAAFEEILALVSRCRTFDTGFRTATFTVIGRDAGGQDSVVVRVDNTFAENTPPDATARTDYYVAIRADDLVATVRVDGRTEAEARALAERAVARLG
jgi:hypothetical protein